MAVLPPAMLHAFADSVADRRFVDRRAVGAYAVIAALATLVAVTVASGRFACDAALFGGTATSLAVFVALGWAMRWVGFAAIGGLVEAVMLFVAIAILAPCCAVILASSALPRADTLLRGADAALFGFDRVALVAALAPWTRLNAVMTDVYNSLTIQPFVLLAVLFFSGRSDRAWTLLTAWALALAASLAIFPLFPAYGTPPYVLRFVEVLSGARDGSLRVLDGAALTGIITFPSFHAAGATILAWGWRTVPRVGVPLVLLNVAMIGTALTVGGHYLVDLPAGMAVAAAALLVARRVVSRSRAAAPTERWRAASASG